MGQHCGVCKRLDREQIDVSLVNETPYRNIERLFRVSKSSLSRHKNNCLPGILTSAIQSSDVAELVEKVQEGSSLDISVRTRADEMYRKGRVAILDVIKRRDF